MDQRQTNWQVIQLTRASLTMERSGGGRMAGERMASTRGTGMSCSSLRPSFPPSVFRHYGGGSVLLITQIVVNCGLDRNVAAPP